MLKINQILESFSKNSIQLIRFNKNKMLTGTLSFTILLEIEISNYSNKNRKEEFFFLFFNRILSKIMQAEVINLIFIS